MSKEKSQMDCEYSTVDGKLVKEAGLGVRHVQSMLLFWCMAVAYGLRVSMSVAVVAMTSNFTDTPGIEVYEWDERTSSLVLSSFFWGYMLMQLPAGQLAHNFGAKTLLLVAMIVNGIVQILLPWGASMAGWKAVCACRIIQGLTQACVMPCSHNLLGKWAPLHERGRLSSYVYAGQSAGTVIILPITGYLAASRWGWPSIFYSSGICSLIFGLVWGFFGSESPAAHKKISEREKLYIESSLGICEDMKKVKLSIPWKSILRSPGMWAIAAAHIGNTWVQLTLYTELPSYMDKVMNVKIKNNGMLTALPFLTNWIMQYVFSHLTDYLISKQYMSMTATRKLANSIGSWVTAAGLVAVAIAPTDNFILIECLLVFSISAKAASYVGFHVNHIDLSPNFAGTMMSISNTMSNSIGTLAPVAAGYILTDNLFDWSTQTRSTILSSFIWGYPVLCIPAGLIVSHFGGKTAILISISINCITCFLMPTVAYRYNWQGICVIRIVQGVSQGFIMPGLHAMLGKWAPLEEKSQLGAVVYAGAQFGSAFALSFSGMIADSIWGWPSIFYGTGLLIIIFLIFWTWIASNQPRDARFISPEEIEYIESSIGVATSAKISTTPFFAILTSMPFWAIVAAHITQNWGFWTLLTGVPLYTRNVLGVNLSANGILSSLPYYVLTVVSFPCARIVDIIIKRKWLSITAARKVSNTAGHWLPACGLIALAYTENTIFSAVSYLTLTTALNVGHFSGFMLVHIDIAPNYAGTLMGFTNCFANLISLLAPLSIGFLVQDESLGTEWRKVFLLAAGVYFLGNLFFITFATSKRQKWNEEPESYGSDDIHTAELRKELEEEIKRRKSESRIISKVSS